DLKIGTTENSTVTQKPLMVMPNAPRFFREGDKITFSAKLSALEDKPQTGSCQLFLFDAISMEPVDSQFKLGKASQPFSVKQGESAVLSWDLEIPFGLGAVTYRVLAKAGNFSDGEENTLPILSNRMLVTESLPLPVSGNSTKSFVFQKLKDSGKSSTIRNHRLTLEYTSNPAWYAVQALPYLMEYPYECNEQIFSRFYANSLASHIANSNPRVKRVFEAWRDTPNSTALLSNLEKNQELKAVLLQETPWVLDARNEAQSKQRIGLLFDLNNMAAQFDSALRKLQQNQSENGGWPWFPGMQDSWWVTQYIVEGFGHLDHLGVKAIREDDRVWSMLESALAYLDSEILRDYQQILKYGRLEDDHLGYLEMHYLYARSFFKDIPLSTEVQVAVDYFRGQADKYWLDKEIYGQGLIALARHRDENKITPQKITKSLKERALHSEELGMWWKGFENGWFWYQAPIETQALMIEVFNDVLQDTASIDELRTWLLKQKQTTNWKTTKATAEACYALLLSGTEWLNTDKLAEITLGSQKIDPTKLDGVTPEAGTGYFKTSWSGSEIKPA
ncbi:MAG TPA: alpha-2-macroglobulin family protein, partial [Candidatus Cloacimonadota bacterium]|nr:alpha-2-macroglobulin family protein [Candidatus Cloacimonadota bacterium]